MEITKSCSKCGCVEFNLTPKLGKYEAVCSDCGSIVSEVKLDKYETVKNTCGKCNNSKFKAKVRKEDEAEYWSLTCAECKTEPEHRFVDEALNDIDAKTRENLILKDKIEELKRKIESLEEKLLSLSYKIEAVDSTIENITDDVFSLQEHMSTQTLDISTLRKRISKLNYTNTDTID